MRRRNRTDPHCIGSTGINVSLPSRGPPAEAEDRKHFVLYPIQTKGQTYDRQTEGHHSGG